MINKKFILITFVLFYRLLVSQTENFRTMMAYAESKLKVENYEEALETYLQLVKLEPKNETRGVLKIKMLINRVLKHIKFYEYSLIL